MCSISTDKVKITVLIKILMALLEIRDVIHVQTINALEKSDENLKREGGGIHPYPFVGPTVNFVSFI